MSLRRFYVGGFLLLLLFDTAGQMGFKLAASSAGIFDLDWRWAASLCTSPWIYVAVAAYVGAFFVWMTILRRAPIGPAFAASHLEIVSVLMLSVLLLGESLSKVQMLGCALVLAGIGVLAGNQEATETETTEP